MCFVVQDESFQFTGCSPRKPRFFVFIVTADFKGVRDEENFGVAYNEKGDDNWKPFLIKIRRIHGD